jgi:hypothetical protein
MVYYYVSMTDTYNVLSIFTDKKRANIEMNKNLILLTLNNKFKILFYEYTCMPYFYLKNHDIISEQCCALFLNNNNK